MTNIESAREGARLFSEGKIEAFAALMDPECVWTVQEGSPFGGTYRGPAEIVEKLFKPLASAVELDRKVASNHEVDAEVMTLGRHTATNRATGKSASADFVGLARWENGKLKSYRELTDTQLFTSIM